LLFISTRLGRRLAALAAAALLFAPIAVPARTRTQTQQTRPGQPPAPTTQLPPNSSSAPVRPENEAQQSAQPQTGVEQERQAVSPETQGPRPPSPRVQPPSQQTEPGQPPQTSTPAGTVAPQNPAGPAGATGPGGMAQPGVPAAPNQGVGTSTVAPAELPTDPPPIAPGFEAPARPLPSAERVGVDMMNQAALTLRDAIALALRNNNDIDASRVNVEIAEFDLTAAQGVYDPVFSTESYYESRTTPTSSSLSGGANGSVTQKDLTGAMRFGGFSPWAGGAYQLDFSTTRLTTSNQFVTLNPQFPSSLSFTYTQPLLRGRRIDDNRRRIEIARKNLSLTDAQFRQRAIEVISQVESAYWDLTFALRNLQVQIDAVRQARTQLESNRRMVEQGVLAPIDLVAANTQITTFEQSVYTAQEAVTRAENSLKTLILPDRTAELWSRPLTPVSEVSLEPPRVLLEQAVAGALRNRPEIQQLQTTAEINEVDARYFRDLTRPQVDLVGNYNAVGLAGSAVQAAQNPRTGGTSPELLARVNELSTAAGLAPLPTPTPTTGSTVSPNLVGGLPQSLSNLVGQDYPTYRVGVRLSLPLRNRTAEANLGRALAGGRLIRNQRAQTEQIIEADVRNSLQALRSAEARLAAAASARTSAELQYESEQRMFRAGTTTLFLVLQRQTELLAARGRELQAQTDLNKAVADFQRSTGNTLDANNVAIRTDTPERQLELRNAESAGEYLVEPKRPNGFSFEKKARAGSTTNQPAGSLSQ
jgi:HAE1 family hydrophobic/amphiphilic exporter-1